jgi:hypothetical protein
MSTRPPEMCRAVESKQSMKDTHLVGRVRGIRRLRRRVRIGAPDPTLTRVAEESADDLRKLGQALQSASGTSV